LSAYIYNIFMPPGGATADFQM